MHYNINHEDVYSIFYSLLCCYGQTFPPQGWLVAGDDENRCGGWKLNINSSLSCLFSKIEGYLKYHQISSDHQMYKSSYQTETENIWLVKILPDVGEVWYCNYSVFHITVWTGATTHLTMTRPYVSLADLISQFLVSIGRVWGQRGKGSRKKFRLWHSRDRWSNLQYLQYLQYLQ